MVNIYFQENQHQPSQMPQQMSEPNNSIDSNQLPSRPNTLPINMVATIPSNISPSGPTSSMIPFPTMFPPCYPFYFGPHLSQSPCPTLVTNQPQWAAMGSPMMSPPMIQFGNLTINETGRRHSISSYSSVSPNPSITLSATTNEWNDELDDCGKVGWYQCFKCKSSFDSIQTLSIHTSSHACDRYRCKWLKCRMAAGEQAQVVAHIKLKHFRSGTLLNTTETQDALKYIEDIFNIY
ncbi:hypothetical protein BLOT_000658 [Blomia tropicalis]|nr:hypothetical protein BLOT_000658 [Blomia tropicalis]